MNIMINSVKKNIINGKSVIIIENVKKVLVDGHDTSFVDQDGTLCFVVIDIYYKIVNGKVVEDIEKNDFHRSLKKLVMERHDRHFGIIRPNKK